MTAYNLECIYDSRKSFYGKAIVMYDNGVYKLCSYGLPIVSTDRKTVKFENHCTTQTTLRHIREFLRQYYINKDYTKKDILKLMEN